MNEIEDRLNAAVRAEAGFGASAVAARVAERRRRRLAAVGAAVLVLVVAIGFAITSIGDDDGATDIVGEGEDDATDGDVGDDDDPADEPSVEFDDDAPVDQVQEDPGGADGVAGPTATDHLIAESPFPLCETLPRDGPATGERYAAQEAMWQAFADQYSFAEWPYVVGFSSPETVWGMPLLSLTRPDQETFDRLLEFFEPSEACVEVPSAELVPPIPRDVVWELLGIDDDVRVTVREVSDCAVKAEHIEPFVLEYDDRVELGVQAWSEAGTAFTDDCPPPAEYTVDLPTPLAGRPLVPATSGPLLVQGPVALGETVGFTVAEVNRAGVELIGDDLIARLDDDPMVRFQVSDVFADPVAGRPRAVTRDQHPWTGEGTILVPTDVPAGTYSIQFLEHPQLNGMLTVTG